MEPDPACLPTGGIISDVVAKRYGMRGRLWWLWGCQTLGGVFCLGMGLSESSFTSTMIMLVFFSLFLQVRIAGFSAYWHVVIFARAKSPIMDMPHPALHGCIPKCSRT